jgi:polyhydroxyalkanoate synthesis regulator phasin
MPTPEPEPSPSETSTPEPTPTPEPIIEPVEEVVDNASEDGIITDEETQAIVDNLLSDGDLSTNEVTDLVDNLQSDGQLSEEEKQLVSDVLVEAYEDSAIPSDVFEASGLDYEDLPPEQPITLENGVVITAEIADAIEIFEDPSELLSAVLTDPGKALKAIANVGADLTPEVRKDAQAITVSAVIVSQVIAGTSALTLARNQ